MYFLWPVLFKNSKQIFKGSTSEGVYRLLCLLWFQELGQGCLDVQCCREAWSFFPLEARIQHSPEKYYGSAYRTNDQMDCLNLIFIKKMVKVN